MTTFNKMAEGHDRRWLLGLNVAPEWMLIVMLGIIFIMGFIMDWIGILLVVVPISCPLWRP